MNRHQRTLATALMCAATAIPAMADTITQTLPDPSASTLPQNLTFDQFDPSLGTLTGVTLQIDLAMTGTGEAVDPDGSSGNFEVDFGAAIEANATVTLDTGLNVTANILDGQSDLCFDFMAPCVLPFNLSDSDSQQVIENTLAPYIGTGTIDGTITGFFASVADPSGFINDTRAVSATLIYEFTPFPVTSAELTYILSEESEEFVVFFGKAITEASIDAPGPLGNFQYDFSQLGDTTFTVTFAAPAGQLIEVNVPTGFQSYEGLGLGISGGSSFEEEQIFGATSGMFEGTSGDPIPGGFAFANFSGVGDGFSFSVLLTEPTPGSTFRFASVTFDVIIPASFTNSFDGPIDFARIKGMYFSSEIIEIPPDPGQWIRLVPDPALCTGDIASSDGSGGQLAGPDGTVDLNDVLFITANWGACPGGTPGCAGDIATSDGAGGQLPGGDGTVDLNDVLFITANWGPCP